MRARVCTLSGVYLWVWNHFVENECEKARMRGEEVKIFGATFRDSAIKKIPFVHSRPPGTLGGGIKKKVRGWSDRFLKEYSTGGMNNN